LDISSLFVELLNKIKPLLISSQDRTIVGRNVYGETVRSLDIKVDILAKKFLRDRGFRGLVVSEEGISNFGANGCIFLDPVDGSLNYARGLKKYGFLIAYSNTCDYHDTATSLIWVAENDKAILGIKNQGVFLVRDYDYKQITLKVERKDIDVVIEVGDTVGEKLSWLRKIASLRHFGSMAYAFSLFIEGSIDGIVDYSSKLKLTDVAAFIPILEELDYQYQIDILDKVTYLNPRIGFLVASNSELFKKILQIINSVQ